MCCKCEVHKYTYET
jgi:hypothetical protein